MQRWMILAISLLLSTGCARQPAVESDINAREIESLRGSLAEVQAENAQLKRDLIEYSAKLQSIQDEFTRVQDISVRSPDESFYEALVQLVYLHLERGGVLPPGMVGNGQLEFGTDLGGKPDLRTYESVGEVDFDWLQDWFRQHPWTSVRGVSVFPRSHAGYQRVDVVVGDGFYLLFGFQDLRLVKLIISDHGTDLS